MFAERLYAGVQFRNQNGTVETVERVFTDGGSHVVVVSRVLGTGVLRRRMVRRQQLFEIVR